MDELPFRNNCRFKRDLLKLKVKGKIQNAKRECRVP